jgi:hypothetical protein
VEDRVVKLTGDRAIRQRAEDRLGFGSVAARVAEALAAHTSDDGLVIGLQGAWGSGKSSLLFLIEEGLKSLGGDRAPTVVNFRPWLISERDLLLPALFRELTAAIDRIYQSRGDSSRASLSKARNAATAVRGFVRALSRAGDLVEFAGEVSSLPPVKWMGKGLKSIGDAFGKDEPISLSTSKDKLIEALRELGQTIVIPT